MSIELSTAARGDPVGKKVVDLGATERADEISPTYGSLSF
jgi:hypothetical protein